MAADIIISARDLGKKYTIGHRSVERVPTLRDAIVRNTLAFVRAGKDILQGKPLVSGDTREEFWALRNVSFDICRGDVVGIIGRNGAGKSTLLKVLSRITEPSEGRVEIDGRVASLLEVGTGFHPELTGRENIFLNGAILGMTQGEIRRKFDEIVAFSEVEKFLDTPVKRYSSGMYVRLAFAVAAHLEPEILIVDEVLAVGDAEFQKKCLGKMRDVAGEGRTVLFVSHNMSAVRTLTRTCIQLQSGRVIGEGRSDEIVTSYLSNGQSGSLGVAPPVAQYRRDKLDITAPYIEAISCSGSDGQGSNIELGDPILIGVDIVLPSSASGLNVNFVLKRADGERIAVINSLDSEWTFAGSAGRHRILANIPRSQFAPGRYFIDTGVSPNPNARAFDVILDYPAFEISNTTHVVHWIDRPWGAVHCSDVRWIVQ